jgi:plastocyanin
MTRTRRRTGLLARTLAALFLAGAPVAALAGPELSASFADPPYAFAASCDLAQPLVFVNLIVANRGEARTTESPVTATDSSHVLGADSTTLRPIAPGAQIALRIPLRRVPTSLGAVGGKHVITVTVGPRRLGPLAVSVPATFCATAATGAAKRIVPASSTQSAIQRPRVNPQPAATTPPGKFRLGGIHSNLAEIAAAARTPAVPRNVSVARGTQECAAHVGLFGALACPAMIKSGNVLVVWDWNAGAGPDAIDGFRLYRVAGGTKYLVYTRADKKDLTLVDLTGPAAGYVGTCFAVSAYAGAYESALSDALCVTRQQIAVLASPTVTSTTPPAQAPKHVVIHVTGDSFPANTTVAAGGDVTWINDDSDEHSVYGPAGSFVGDLYANGGRFTYTFRDIGTNYAVPYLCQYHAGMRGTITVVTNR